MAQDMSATQIPLTVVVAVTTKGGIGRNNALPWPMLKADMAYFARITKRVPTPTNTGSLQSDALKSAILDGVQRNAVIMGRKTWDSIPPKFRPLKDRTNIVISTQPRSSIGNLPDEVIVAPDIISGLRDLEKRVYDGTCRPLGRAFVMGGTSIYAKALELPQTNRILLTRIHKDYDCDSYFPINVEDKTDSAGAWSHASKEVLSKFVGEDVPEGLVSESSGDDTVQLEFNLYQREML